MTTLVRVASDGRLYPPSWPHMPPAERQRLRDIEHDYHCRQGLSIRQTQAAMAREGIRRSVGQLHQDLTRFECSHCSTAPRPAPPPDPAQRARPVAWY